MKIIVICSPVKPLSTFLNYFPAFYRQNDESREKTVQRRLHDSLVLCIRGNPLYESDDGRVPCKKFLHCSFFPFSSCVTNFPGLRAHILTNTAFRSIRVTSAPLQTPSTCCERRKPQMMTSSL